MSYIPARDLARVTLGRGTGRKVQCMLSAYFDDSGTDSESPIMVLGGLIGDDRQWSDFEREWSALLAHPLPGKPPLSKWSSYDCLNSVGEFTSYKPGERDALTHDFRQIIIGCDLLSYAVCVDKSPWRGPYKDVMTYRLGLPDEIAMYSVVEYCHKIAGVSLIEPKVGIVFDAGWSNTNIANWALHYIKDDDMNDRVSSVTFGKVADYLGLQGADLIATETFWFNKAWMKLGDEVKERAHFSDIRYGDLAKGVIYREKEIRDMLNRVLADAGETPITSLF